MDLWREGNLTDGNPHTGDILSLELYSNDIQRLINPKHRQIMNRFLGLRHGLVPGWAAEDKIHVEFKEPNSEEDTGQYANLSLDPGGDLYFTIWDSERLKQAEPCEVFDDINTFVRHDPSQILQRIGIVAARIYGLSSIAWAKADSL